MPRSRKAGVALALLVVVTAGAVITLPADAWDAGLLDPCAELDVTVALYLLTRIPYWRLRATR